MNATLPGNGTLAVDSTRTKLHNGTTWIISSVVVIVCLCLPTAKGTQRLNMLVKTLLLRRTKGQTGAGGKPLVSLDPITHPTISSWVIFSRLEKNYLFILKLYRIDFDYYVG